jgi:dolichol kinase
MQKEILRQTIHASGLLFILMENFLSLPYLIALAIFAAAMGELIYQIDKKRYIFLFSKILRSCRRNENERGFIYFFVGLSLTLILFGQNLAVANAAILSLALGDSLSTIVGTRWGKHPLIFNPRKTWEGSLTFVVAAFIGALTQVPLIAALAGAIAGAITEAYSPVDDNLTIPLVVGTVITLVIYFLY